MGTGEAHGDALWSCSPALPARYTAFLRLDVDTGLRRGDDARGCRRDVVIKPAAKRRPLMVKTALDDLTLPPSAQLLGWRLLDARPQEGWIKVGFDGKREFCNPTGLVQGGFLTAMIDPTMGAAVIVMSEGRLYASTVSITVNFLAPAKPGPIVAEAKVTQLGKTIAFVEGKLLAQDSTLLATATTSVRLLEAARALRA